jgi:hypothetical protein
MPVVTPSLASIETGGHQAKTQLLDPLAHHREADQAAAVFGHEIDRIRRRHLRRNDQIAFVLAVLVIDQDEDAAVACVLDHLLDIREETMMDGQVGHTHSASNRRLT